MKQYDGFFHVFDLIVQTVSDLDLVMASNLNFDIGFIAVIFEIDVWFQIK